MPAGQYKTMTKKEYMAAYFLRYPERRKKCSADYYARNSEAVLARNRIYYQNNKETIMERRRVRCLNRRHSDPAFRLMHGCRGRINRLLRGKDKSSRSRELIGCAPADLKRHIEAQFLPGMSWDNWSMRGWHVDHIKPCVSFDLSQADQQRACFNYTNLRPLWAADNLRKGGRIAA